MKFAPKRSAQYFKKEKPLGRIPICLMLLKRLIVCAFLCCLFFSCQQKVKKSQSDLNTTIGSDKSDQKPINIDTLNRIFDDLNRFNNNYSHSYNLKINYPNLISRIEIQRNSSDNKIFDEMIKLIKLYSLQDNYSSKETDKLNKNIIAAIFNKNQLKEIQSLSNSTISIDNTKSLEFNLERIIERYNRIDFYFKKQYYFQESLVAKFWEICPLYYEIKYKIEARKIQKWNNLKQQLLKEEVSFIENEAFLKSIILNEKDTITPSYLKAIAPVFEKVNGQYRIYNMEPDYYGDKLIFDRSIAPKKIKDSNFDYSEFILDTKVLNHQDSIKFYAYGIEERTLIKLLGFGYQPNECINAYFVFPFIPLKNSVEKLLFSSRYKLELDFNNYPQIDSQINKQYPDICIDCPSGRSKQKTYARLKGYKNIYFTFAAEKEIDDTDTFIRAIYLVQNNEVVELWSKDYDSFGCTCL